MTSETTAVSRPVQPSSGWQKDGNDDGAQEKRIKRPIKTKKMNLESFDERGSTPATEEEIRKKLKKLASLSRSGAGPLRLREVEVDDKIVLYLAPRTWGQYFYEKLCLFPAEKEARQREARAAIERYIRPWLERHARKIRSRQAEPVPPDMLKNDTTTDQTGSYDTFNLDLLDKLHRRVYTKRIDGPDFYRNSIRDARSWHVDGNMHTEHMRTVFNGTTTVPQGLSIAQIAPFKVMADVRIMVPETRALAKKYGPVGGNGTPCKEVLNRPEGNRPKSALEQDYYDLLEAYGVNAAKVVLEVQGIDDDHWNAAYSAAKRWMKKRNKTASVMLVPLYRPEEHVAWRNSMEDKNAWPSLMAKKLGLEKNDKEARRKPDPYLANHKPPPLTEQSLLIDDE